MTAPEAEVHIAGVLVHVRPERAAAIGDAIRLLPRAEVTHATPDGRLVAVFEAASSRAVVQQLEGLRALEGVLNIALVYQHAEPEEALNQEMQE